jgi:hypothetical protein
MSTALATAAGNGDTSAKAAAGGWLYQIAVGGTFDGATVRIQLQAPAPVSAWISVGDPITAAAIQNIEIPAGTLVRLNVAGGGGTAAINSSLSILRNR